MRYSQIKQALLEAEIIDEVSMSPTSLEKFANSPEAEGMLIGIEFEMCVPNARTDDEDNYPEPDYDANESAWDIGEIVNFFRGGDYGMGRQESERFRDQLNEEFWEWQTEAADNYIDNNPEELDDKTGYFLNDAARDAADEHEDEFVAAAKEELGSLLPDDDAAIEERVRELKTKWIERWIDEQVEAADSREYEYARERAIDDLRDDYYNSGDGDEHAWLSDIGVSDMSDASSHWNLEWPYYTDGSSGGENDVDQVAEDFSDHTGYEARGYSGYHSGSRSAQQSEGYFIIEPDGSIDADEGDAGLEFISPAMPLKDGIDMMKRVQSWAKAAGCYTNKSTGLHMNISVPGMDRDKLDFVKLALFMGDQHVLEQFGRTYNSYCKSAMKIVQEKAAAPEIADAVLAKMKEHLNTAAGKLIHSGITQKYTSINTKDKYVEFRGPGGDYLDQDLTKLTSTALRLAQSLRIATDDNAYKQEYAKKLYKLIDSGKQGPMDTVKLFTDYAMGKIKKDELITYVQHTQQARKEKKGQDEQYWVMNKDGTGGKQLVFASSATDAVVKGGKQMGMSRNDSILKLKAEPYESDEVNDLHLIPGVWRDWVDTMINKRTADIIEVRRRIEQGEYNSVLTSQQQRDAVVKLIDAELRSRQDAGETGEETRWKVTIEWSRNGPLEGYEPVYIDAVSPREAKVKAAPIFDRQMNLSSGTVNPNELEAVESTQDEGHPEQSWIVLDGFNRPVDTVQARTRDEALHIYGSVNNVDTRNYTATPGANNTSGMSTTSRELFDSLPEGTRSWLERVGEHHDLELRQALDHIEAGRGIGSGLYSNQVAFVKTAIETELRRRSNNNEVDGAEAGGNPFRNPVFNTLPQHWQDFLNNDLPYSADMHIINMLRNLSREDAGRNLTLTDQQLAYIRILLKRQLRANGINPDDEAPADLTSPDDEDINDLMGGDSDEEEETPQGVDPEHSEWEIYNPATGQVVSRVSQGDVVYAVRKAREHEQDLGLANGALDIRAINQTNESIKDLRRLAGLL